MTPPISTTQDLLASLNQPLPFSAEAEDGILACLLQLPDRMDGELVSSRLFHVEANRRIFLMLADMHRNHLPIDPAAVTVYARKIGDLERIGGAFKLSELGMQTPIPAHFNFYLNTLKEAATLRLMIGALAESLSLIQGYSATPGENTLSGICQEVETVLAQVAQEDFADEIPHRPIADILQAVIDDAQAQAENAGRLPGVSTGIAWLDEKTGGLEAGRLWVIAAASSDGKSSLARQMLECACEQGHACDIYTYEMMDKEEGGRMICSKGSLPRDTIKFGKYTRAQGEAFHKAVGEIKGWDIRVIDVAGVRIERIISSLKRRRKKLKDGQKLIALIDYVQLALTSQKASSRQREIAHITSMLKQACKTLGITIIIPSQINTDGEAREAMDIENDADVMIKIKRLDGKKEAKTGYQKSREKDMGESEESNVREIAIHKNRDGPKNVSYKMRLLGQFFRFEPHY